MRPDFRTFQYSSLAKIPIHHGARTDRKGRIDRKQAYNNMGQSDYRRIPQDPLIWAFSMEFNILSHGICIL